MSSHRTARLLIRDDKGACRPASADEVLHAARRLLKQRMRPGVALSSSGLVKAFLMLQLSALDHERFVALYLDSQLRLIAYRELFRGTVSQTVVPVREVAREALRLNAVSVILAHNHPAGTPQPSRADLDLTKALTTALALVDVRLVDHLIVAGAEVVSLAERGWLVQG